MNASGFLDSVRKKRSIETRKRFYDKEVQQLLTEYDETPLTPEEKKAIQSVWGQYDNINMDWIRFYKNATGRFNPYYFPPDVYFGRTCRKLNGITGSVRPEIEDKNYLDLLFCDVSRTVSVLHNIDGVLLNSKYEKIDLNAALNICMQYDELVVKPSIDTSGAKNVAFVHPKSKKEMKELLESYKQNYVVQLPLRQHESLSKLNPDSVNTIRVLSLFWENEVVILGSLIRIGVPGVRVDNLVRSNGFSCGIDTNGRFVRFGYDKHGHKTETLGNGLVLNGYPIPGYEKVIAQVKQLHPRIPQHRLIGWDYTVDTDESPILIESNMFLPEINFHQFAMGPIFGEGDLFREIVKYTYEGE